MVGALSLCVSGEDYEEGLVQIKIYESKRCALDSQNPMEHRLNPHFTQKIDPPFSCREGKVGCYPYLGVPFGTPSRVLE